jgi:hypothetical protein
MLFNSVIGIDTEGAMSAYRASISDFDIATGRWGGAFLDNLWRITPYNPYLATFSSLCFLGISALLWCYVFSAASDGACGISTSIRDSITVGSGVAMHGGIGEFLFCALYITSPVWNAIMYFHPVTFFFSVMLCPVVVLLIFKGILFSRFYLIAIGVLLSAFLFSVYQAVIPFLCSGVLIYFFLLMRRSATSAVPIFPFLLKVIQSFAIAYLLYFISDLIVKYAFDVQNDNYVSNFNTWGRDGFANSIKRILKTGYELAIVPFLFKSYNLYGSLVLLPCGLIFILLMWRHGKQTGQARTPYIITGLCVLASAMLLPVLGANRPPLRTMFSLPLVTGFIVLYIVWIADVKRRKMIIAFLTAFVVFVSLYQAQIAIQMQYSDYQRYNADVRLAEHLDERIQQTISESTVFAKDTPVKVAIFGRYSTYNFNKNFIKGEVSGHSIFEWDTYDKGGVYGTAPTRRGVGFMQALGMNYIMDNEIMSEAATQAAQMPSYPASGCIKIYKDCIIVHL